MHSPRISRPRFAAAAIGLATSAVLATSVMAQRPAVIRSASETPSTQVIPRLSLLGANSRSVAAWPGVSYVTDRDAYVVVFAVTRGADEFPLQVLAPSRPRESAFVRGGERRSLRRLDEPALAHLVRFGEAPILIAFASTVAPDLSTFSARGDWGRDLIVDGDADEPRALAKILADALFHDANVRYDLVISGARSPQADTRYASSDRQYSGCDALIGRYTYLGRDGWDLPVPGRGYDTTYRGVSYGAGVSLPYGVSHVSVVGTQGYGISETCPLYYATWWPRVVQRPPYPRTPRSPDVPVALSPRTPNPPRLPRPADLPTLDSSWASPTNAPRTRDQDRKVDRQIDRQYDRERDRQPDRQLDRNRWQPRVPEGRTIEPRRAEPRPAPRMEPVTPVPPRPPASEPRRTAKVVDPPAA